MLGPLERGAHRSIAFPLLGTQTVQDRWVDEEQIPIQ